MNKKSLITAGVVEDLYFLSQGCYSYDSNIKRCLDTATTSLAKLRGQTSSNSINPRKDISKKTESYLAVSTLITELFKWVTILITPDIPEEVLVSKVRLIKEEMKKELIVKSVPKRFNEISLSSNTNEFKRFKIQMAKAIKVIKKRRIPSDEYKLLTCIKHVGIYKEPFNKWLKRKSQGWRAQGETRTIEEILQKEEYYVDFLKKKLSLVKRVRTANNDPIILDDSQLSTLLKALSKDQLLVNSNTIKRQCSRFLQILDARGLIRAAQQRLEKNKEVKNTYAPNQGRSV